VKTYRQKAAAFILGACFLSVISNLQGADLYTYDLDSLIGMTSEVVEGKIVGQHQEKYVDVWEIEVSNTYAGDLTPGQKIKVTDLNLFCVSDKDEQDANPLKQNDELFLFLDRAKSTTVHNFPTNTGIYWPVPSGIRFVSGKKAVEFWRWSNPGPYRAEAFRAETNLDVPTVTELRRQIHDSIERVGRWNQILKKKAAPEDIPGLLALLRERKARTYRYEEDYITAAVCQQLADLHDPPALLEAARTPGPVGFRENWTLAEGLATPDGRKQLIAKVADEHEPINDRVRWAGLLGYTTMMTGAATFYEYSVSSLENHHENEQYLKKIAELATNEQTDTNLQTTLFANLRWLAGVYNPNSGDAMFITEDGKDAESIVHSFWERTDSQTLKYEAETILYPLSLVESNSSFGPVVAILKPGDYDQAARTVGYDLEYMSEAKGSWSAKVALVNLKTGQKTRYDVPSKYPITSGQGGIGGNIDIPADFPSGRYRVFAEFYTGEKVVATSHYFETDL
jgi:hypothetical protein